MSSMSRTLFFLYLNRSDVCAPYGYMRPGEQRSRKVSRPARLATRQPSWRRAARASLRSAGWSQPYCRLSTTPRRRPTGRARGPSRPPSQLRAPCPTRWTRRLGASPPAAGGSRWSKRRHPVAQMLWQGRKLKVCSASCIIEVAHTRMREMARFQAILQVKAFQQDPLTAVTQHLKNSVARANHPS